MANLQIKDGATATKYLSATGAGSDVDPFVPAHAVTGAVSVSNFPATQPVSIAAVVPVTDNSGSLTVDGTVAATQSGTWDVGTLTTITNGVKDGGASWVQSFGVSGAAYTSADASAGPIALTDAPTSGQKLVIDDLIFSVGSTAMQVDFKVETSGTILLTLYCPANSFYQITPRGKLKLPTADKRLMIDTSAAGNISVTAFYHSEI